MADFDYVETAQEAAELLAEFGALATVTATPAPVDDGPDTGQPDPLPTSVTAWGVIFDYTDKAIGTQPDSLIRAGDRQLFIAAVDESGVEIPESAVPVEARVVAPDGDLYVVKDCKPLNPAGVPVLYELRVRRP